MDDITLIKAIIRATTTGNGPPHKTLDEVEALLKQRQRAVVDTPAEAPKGRHRRELSGHTRDEA